MMTYLSTLIMYMLLYIQKKSVCSTYHIFSMIGCKIMIRLVTKTKVCVRPNLTISHVGGG